MPVGVSGVGVTDPPAVETEPLEGASARMPFNAAFIPSFAPGTSSAVVVFDALGSPDAFECSSSDVLERGRTFGGTVEASEEGSWSVVPRLLGNTCICLLYTSDAADE